jgi:hypothetical protein
MFFSLDHEMDQGLGKAESGVVVKTGKAGLAKPSQEASKPLAIGTLKPQLTVL